jgi:hypothetical protein
VEEGQEDARKEVDRNRRRARRGKEPRCRS